jgi:hypothetical protein
MPSTPAQRQRAAERKRQAAEVEKFAAGRTYEEIEAQEAADDADAAAAEPLSETQRNPAVASEGFCDMCGRSWQNCECDR